LGASLPGTNTQSQQDVTGALQTLINNNAKSVSMWALPDPARRHHKALCAIISNNGTPFLYMHVGYISVANGAVDPIDSTQIPREPSVGARALLLAGLSLTCFGYPTPTNHYVFPVALSE
jgi:hypothetical protein